MLYYNEGDFGNSLKECNEVLSMDKTQGGAHWLSFKVYIRLGEGESALVELQKLLQKDTLTSKPSLENIERVYAESGLGGLINWLIEIKTTRTGLFPNGELSELYSIAGRKEDALKTLELYVENHAGGGALLRLINKLDFKPLRSEPRFKTIIDKLGLTEQYLRRMNMPGYKN
jgi:hypothetical protein